MDWLIENPIATMDGPAFLSFYAIVIAITMGFCADKINRSRQGQEIPLTPLHPDPYEIAYLRGGANEVFRLALFSLFQRGWLEISGKGAAQQIGPSAVRPILSSLSALEQTVYAEFAAPKKAGSLFHSAGAERVEGYCQGYALRMRADGLLETEETGAARRQAGKIGFITIAGLGGYKLFAALQYGHSNVGFLIVMGIVALFCLAVICSRRRLSQSGQAYLQNLQTAFARLKTAPMTEQADADAEEIRLLTMGVFGVGALTGTPHAPFGQMFQRAAASSSASCGGGVGCGGSSGGDSGGGHSCGGHSCGGHGCGGCGGH